MCLLTLKHLVSLQARTSPSFQDELDLDTADKLDVFHEWWRKGDIRTTKPRKSFDCWVKTSSDVPTGPQKSLTEAMTGPQYNVGKDAYIVDLESDEKLY